MPDRLALGQPLKITSSIESPRSCLALCSPMTQRIASETFVLPQPLGPTTPVMPSPNWTSVRVDERLEALDLELLQEHR